MWMCVAQRIRKFQFETIKRAKKKIFRNYTKLLRKSKFWRKPKTSQTVWTHQIFLNERTKPKEIIFYQLRSLSDSGKSTFFFCVRKKLRSDEFRSSAFRSFALTFETIRSCKGFFSRIEYFVLSLTAYRIYSSRQLQRRAISACSQSLESVISQLCIDKRWFEAMCAMNEFLFWEQK